MTLHGWDLFWAVVGSLFAGAFLGFLSAALADIAARGNRREEDDEREG